VTHWLLQSFATEATIATACQRVLNARQTSDEHEEQFATRLIKYAADAGSVFTERELITTYLDGLLPFAGNLIRGHVVAIKRQMFTKLQAITFQVLSPIVLSPSLQTIAHVNMRCLLGPPNES
jgi:hypothetical protein